MTQALRAPATGTRTARAASGGARATATSAQANPSGANASAASSLPVATALQISDVAITSRRAINASATAWIGAVSSRWQRSSRSAACDSASSKLASACAAAQRCRQSLERAAARRSRDGVTRATAFHLVAAHAWPEQLRRSGGGPASAEFVEEAASRAPRAAPATGESRLRAQTRRWTRSSPSHQAAPSARARARSREGWLRSRTRQGSSRARHLDR